MSPSRPCLHATVQGQSVLATARRRWAQSEEIGWVHSQEIRWVQSQEIGWAQSEEILQKAFQQTLDDQAAAPQSKDQGG